MVNTIATALRARKAVYKPQSRRRRPKDRSGIGHEHGACKVVYKMLVTGAPKRAGIVKHHYKATLRTRKAGNKMLASGGRGSKHLELSNTIATRLRSCKHVYKTLGGQSG